MPNVSLCEEENEVHYREFVDPRLILRFTVTDGSTPTQLYRYNTTYDPRIGEPINRGVDKFDSIEIDGTEVSIADLDTAEGTYQLSNGNHTVKYSLKDPTIISSYLFSGCGNLTNIKLPNTVTRLYLCAFNNCGITSLTIPDTVTRLDEESFSNCVNLQSVVLGTGLTYMDIEIFTYCTSLTSITSLAMTAPTTSRNTFSSNLPANGTLYVPRGGTGYDTWMQNQSYYLGYYNWTKVEQ